MYFRPFLDILLQNEEKELKNNVTHFGEGSTFSLTQIIFNNRDNKMVLLVKH